MLTDLHIENIAVIERADVRFAPGFNVLTGETGAGKSILIDSIGAVLGDRVSRDLVRTGAEKATVTAVFTDSDTDAWLEENGIDPEEELILQRRLDAGGKSACRVNGVPVSAQQLKSLGRRLLDIHGQNDGRALLDEERHLEYLDRFGETEPEQAAFSEAYARWRGIRRDMDRLRMDEAEKARLTERLTEEVRELSAARLSAGEEEELTAQRDRMLGAEKLSEALEGAYQALYEADSSAISLVGDAAGFLSSALSLAPELQAAAEGVSQARFLLEDAAERVNDVRASLAFSEADFDAVESRLSLLRRLERKYAADEAGLIDRLADSEKRLGELEGSEGLLVQLRKDLKKARELVLAAGKALTERRSVAAKALGERVRSELKYLNMPSVAFVTDIQPLDTEEGFDATGCDSVRFLMSANAGETPGRIAHIASGGELSRIMLALKSVFSERDGVGTLIFDEIDTGVSGVTAQRVAEKMGALAARRQLICITHLPQIAAMADAQFRIAKAEKGGRTFTTVSLLDRDGRVEELSRLYGGDSVTDTTRKSAAEQLAAAERFKQEKQAKAD